MTAERAQEFDDLAARYEQASMELDKLNGKTDEWIAKRDGIGDLAPPTLAVAAAMLEEADAADEAAKSTGTLRANLKALNKDIESFSDVRPLSKVNREIDKQRRLMNKAAKEGNYAAWARHKASLEALRDEREQSRTARKALGEWNEKTKAVERLSKKYEVNRKTVRDVMRENQGNIEDTKAELDKLYGSAVKVDGEDPTITVTADTAGASRNLSDLSIQIQALIDKDTGRRAAGAAPGRAVGGPVSAFTPYIVGERGPEVFTPTVSGHITPNDSIGGDTYNITPRIYGSPQQAKTPREVVAEIRRSARIGLIGRPRRSSWEPV